MAMAKKMKPGVAKRVSDRKAFVSENMASKGTTAKQARQRFYVQTRMSELEKKTGKPVSAEKRKELQQKFQSGDVARKGFAAPKKKMSGSSSSSSVAPKVTPKVQPRTDTEGRMGPKSSPKGRPATSNMQGIRGYGRVDSKGRTGMGATAPKRSGMAQANPRTAKLVGGVLGGLKSIGSSITPNRANPSRVSQSAAKNRADKAAMSAPKKTKKSTPAYKTK
jgi:hypothetical protein